MRCDIYPAKGQFRPDEPIQLIVENENEPATTQITIHSIDGFESSFSEAVQVGRALLTVPPCKPSLTASCVSGEEHLPVGGYGVKAVFTFSNGIEIRNTAFEIREKGYVIRYGFLSDFTLEDNDTADIEAMAKMHITHVQFYDWSYHHDDLVAETDDYCDMMGKHNNLTVIRNKINACHKFEMKALGYGAIYAASKSYRDAHPEQSLYDGAGKALCFIDTFYIMNPERSNPWHDHIIGEYRKAVEIAGFDGIHMDTYGTPKRAKNADGKMVYLEDCIPGLIDDTHQALANVRKSGDCAPTLIFNNVGTWPYEETANAEQDAIYMEMWEPCDRYRDIGMMTAEAFKLGKPVVIAAYPAAFRTATSAEALESQLYLSFIIAMHGGTQLFFGEENAVITQGYYADYTKLDEEQLHMIRRYQDFFVQYGDLFYDRTLKDVSLTHQGWDNPEYRFSPAGSADGEAGKIWYHIRENRERKIIYIVNLKNNDDKWAEGKRKPVEKEVVKIKVQVFGEPQRVWGTSPDEELRGSSALDYSSNKSTPGLELEMQVSLLRCAVVVIEGV